MQLTKLLARFGLAAVLLSTLNFQLSTAHAQGTAFTYQGVLSQNGAAINGSNDLTFTLYNAVSAGATVGTSNVVNDLVMSNGLFTVTLDFGAGAFDGTARWLQIAARPGASTGAYTNLAPRTPITPTPYAMYAGGANAANLVGTVADARLSANVGLRAGGNAFSGNQIITGGNVGIGTATPSNLLDVAASGVIGNSTVLGLNIHDTLNRGTKVSFGYNVPGTEFNGMRAVVNPGTALCGNSGDLLFYTWECNTAPSREVMRINGRGNVGISTTNPVTTLDVRSAIPAITVGTTFGTSGALYFGNSGHGVKRAYSGINDVGLYTTAADVYLSANGTATSEFVLKNNGNVGIGTANPSNRLSVAGHADISGFLTLGNTNIGSRLFLKTGSDTYGFSHSDGTRELATYLDGAGGWIGTVSADPLLFFVNNGSAVLNLSTNNNAYFLGEISATAVNITSDRNAKEQFKPVNAREVLAKVVGLPITEWQYKKQSDARHIGPMAQDFREAFTLGHDEKHISTVDEGGVALAAIQGLNEKLEEKTQEVDALKKSVATLTELVNKLAAQQNGGAK